MDYGPNELAVRPCTTARTGTAVRTSITEPGHMTRSEPRRCHIVVHL